MAAGFAVTYHFLVDGTLFKYLAVEFFGLLVSLLAFWGLIHTNAGISLEEFGGDVGVYIATLDDAFTMLPASQQGVFLQHFEEELFLSDSQNLSVEELELLWQWFYGAYSTTSSIEHGAAPTVSMQQSVLDFAASPSSLVQFASSEEESYSVSSYLDLFYQLGILDA